MWKRLVCWLTGGHTFVFERQPHLPLTLVRCTRCAYRTTLNDYMQTRRKRRTRQW